MDATLQPSESLIELVQSLKRSGLVRETGPDALRRAHHVTAHLVAKGVTVRLIDSANAFDGYLIARLLRSLSTNEYGALRKIQLTRVFARQALLEKLEVMAETAEPVVVLQEGGGEGRTERDIDYHLDRLSQAAGVLVAGRY